MFSQKFKACLWKNYKGRKLSWFLTILEIIFPAILFGLLSYIHLMFIRKKIKDAGMEFSSEIYNMTRLVEEGFRNRTNVDLLFAPVSNFSVKIMESLFNTFTQHNITHKIRAFDGMEGGEQVVSWLAAKYFREESSVGAANVGYGFLFQEPDNVLTDDISLNYTILSTLSNVNTKNNFPDFIQEEKQAKEDDYIRGGIPVLQWHIEKTFIDIFYGEKIPFEMVLKSFPYHKGANLERNEKFFITVLLPLFTMISYIFFIPVVIRRVVQEKASGVKELMKIAGLTSWHHWGSWLVHTTAVFVFTVTIVTVILCFSFTKESGILDYVDVTVLWLLLFLFCTASLILCFAVTTFFNNPVAAMSCGVILWIGTFTVFNPLVKADRIPWIVRLAICLFPTAAVTTGFNIISVFDGRNEKLTWSNIFQTHPGSLGMNIGIVYLMLLIDMLVFSVVTWYVDNVKPGTFGIAKSWNFAFQQITPTRIEPPSGKDTAVIEEPVSKLKVGVYIYNLKKVYSNDVVGLDGLTMNIYQNVITVLLGHNGAGKSSLIGIITGLHSPTSGGVYVGGEDIFSNMKRFHNNLGVCFQFNYLCDYLTVFEHFVFFGMVKGMTFKKAKRDGMEILKDMNLLDKKKKLITHLSQGQRRRVSLAVAMIGNPKVLLLDEPTAGMDPNSRREVWELILSKRGEHTIIISTQFMEEADVLGDWIAILDHGKVVCYGTSAFLKSVYGAGYHLSVSKDRRIRNDAITKIVKKRVHLCKVQTDLPTQIVYNLPLEETAKFPDLFRELEKRRNELGIRGMGVQCTTIEEVFLKVGELLQDPRIESFTDYLLSYLPKHFGATDNITGYSLYYQQFKALLVKKLLFDVRNMLLLVIMTIIPLAIVAISFPQTLKLQNVEALPPYTMSLSRYGQTEAFFSLIPENGFDKDYADLNRSYTAVIESQGGKVLYTNNMGETLTEFAKKHSKIFRMHTVVSATFSKNVAEVYFNNIPLHSVPLAINVMTNALFKHYFPKNKSNIVFTYTSVDVSAIEDTCIPASMRLGENIGHQWAVSMPQCLLCVMTLFIMLPAVERSCTFKHLQLMTGVPPWLYWLACFLWDFFLYILVVILIMITIILSDVQHIFTKPEYMGLLLLILLLYGLSGTFYAYFSSNFGSSTSKIVGNYLVFSISFGMISALLLCLSIKSDYNGQPLIPRGIYQPLRYILPLCPHYSVVFCIVMLGGGVYQNNLCKRCTEKICKEEPLLVFNSKEHPYGLLLELLYLASSWILYLVLLLLTDAGFFQNLYWKLKDMTLNKEFDGVAQLNGRSDVRREMEKTMACTKIRSVDPSAVFMCVGIAKVFSKKRTKIQPMTFRVRKGECFGLLGTNGAGKSSVFRLLVGQERPTFGDAINYNHTLRRNRTKYLHTIGYCPQLAGLNYDFTGEEILRLYAQLRGVHPKRVETEVDNWIRLLALEDNRSNQCGTYSGGTQRKLSTALALIGHPRVIFLDEPTAGVDPFGRRNLWKVLKASRDFGHAVVLTSHSMQECEMLCARLTILVQGRMVCLGNIDFLKKKFGQGHTLAFILNFSEELQNTVPLLKAEVYKKFTKVKLKDEHQRLLHFHVKDEDIRLSELFGAMEELKKSFPVIETYILTDTTLEQVFLSFAKGHIKSEVIL